MPLSSWYEWLPQLIITVGLLVLLVFMFADPVLIVLEMYLSSKRKRQPNTYVCEPVTDDEESPEVE